MRRLASSGCGEPVVAACGRSAGAQHHGEAAAGGVLGAEGAAHRLGQAAGQGQAEADAGVVVAVAEALERQEDPVRGPSAGCPGPWSMTRSSTRPPCSLAVTVGGWSGGL